MPVRRIIAIEFFCTGLLAALGLAAGGAAAQSIALGGLTSVIPNVYFALRVDRGLKSGGGVGALVAGELGKLLLTASLFVVVFVAVKDLDPLLFFVALGAMQLVHWVVLFYVKAGMN